MKGDFTRFSFDPTKHYSGVLMQQGRVQLDADWNEQIATQTRYSQLVTTDLVGLTGAPATGGGFRVTVSTDGTQLLISAGRMYVNGLLCELDLGTTYTQQIDYPGAVYPAFVTPPGKGKDVSGNYVYLAYLDAWERHVTAIEDPSIAEIALGGPDTGTRARTLAQVKLAALSSDGTPGSPPTPVPVADWASITAPSQAELAAVAFVPDTPGSLSLSNAFVNLGTFPAPVVGPPPAIPPVDFSTGFSLEAWVYLPGPTIASGLAILYLGDGTTPNTISLTTGSASGTLVLTIGSASCTAAGALDASTWTHFAASIAPPPPTSPPGTPPVVTLYKNGAPLSFTASAPVALPPNANRAACFLGSAASGPAGAFTGMLAEVRIWSIGLAAPTVSSRINANTVGLVAYYELNEVGSNAPSVADASPNRRNGTVNVNPGGSFVWSNNGPALAPAGSSTAQYAGPENQLYRVEVHAVSGGAVTIKWSRDNGSIVSAATLSAASTGATPTQTLTLTTPVRDDVMGWAVSQYVEITTLTGDLQGAPGTLAQIKAIQGNALTIAAVTAPAPGAVTVRRWDSDPTLAANTFTPPASTPATPWLSSWIPLENGIAVQLSGQAPFLPGDYWMMPARTATQALEWPLAPNGQPVPQLPRGIRHRYAQLAKVYLTPSGTWTTDGLPELRQTFPNMSTAVQNFGALTWDATSVQVNGTFNVGTHATPQTSNFWGPINAYDGINVYGAPLNVGVAGTGQPLNVYGPINAFDGLNVTGAATNIGSGGSPQQLNVFGLVNATEGVTVSGGLLNATTGLVVSGGGASIGVAGAPQPLTVYGPFQVGTATAKQPSYFEGGLTVDNDPILLKRLATASPDPTNGLRYAGGNGTGSPFVSGTNPDGPVLFGAYGGGLGTVNATGPLVPGYALTWAGQNVTVLGTLSCNGPVTVGANGAGKNLDVYGTLTAWSTLSVRGLLGAEDGLIVNGGLLTASDGLTVTAGLLTADAGLTVAAGLLTAKAGLTVTAGLLTAQAGLTVTAGLLTADAGLTVAAGLLTAKAGLTVTAGLLTADAGLTVTGGPVNIGTSSLPQPLNVIGAVNIGVSGGATQPLNIYGYTTGGGASFSVLHATESFEVLTGTLTPTLSAGSNVVTVSGTFNVINGTVNSAVKNFRIPHPLDSERDLVHSSLEGPEIGVYYRGEARLVGGTATVELPPYFEGLTRREGRTVQLTPIWDGGDDSCSPLCATEVREGCFRVRAVDKANPRQRFYWEVKAVRADQAPLEVEAPKRAERSGRP